MKVRRIDDHREDGRWRHGVVSETELERRLAANSDPAEQRDLFRDVFAETQRGTPSGRCVAGILDVGATIAGAPAAWPARFLRHDADRKEGEAMRDEIETLIDDFERGNLSRRQLIATLMALGGAVAGLGGRTARAAEGGSTFTALGIDHVALRVSNVPRSRDFYRDHLGLTPTRCSERSCFLSCGDDFLALFQGGSPGLDHFSFSVPDYRPERAVRSLRTAGLEPERRGGRVYFRDPDGIELQVSAG